MGNLGHDLVEMTNDYLSLVTNIVCVYRCVHVYAGACMCVGTCACVCPCLQRPEDDLCLHTHLLLAVVAIFESLPGLKSAR